MEDWQATQNEVYLNLLQNRLLEPKLTWVDQFVEIINEEICRDIRDRASKTLHDYGCNVGHFFRGIEDIDCDISYKGFDISETYLRIAKENFGHKYFFQADITDPLTSGELVQSDISVISATLEHLENYESALTNIFSRTKNLVVMRTLVGDVALQDWCKTIGAKSNCLVRQFTIDDLTTIPRTLGWQYRQEVDRATLGEVKMVCNFTSIPRRQAVIVFQK